MWPEKESERRIVEKQVEPNFPVGGYIIGSLTAENGLSVSPRPHVHASKYDARREAERLANKTPGKRFVVLQNVGSVVAIGVAWE